LAHSVRRGTLHDFYVIVSKGWGNVIDENRKENPEIVFGYPRKRKGKFVSCHSNDSF